MINYGGEINRTNQRFENLPIKPSPSAERISKQKTGVVADFITDVDSDSGYTYYYLKVFPFGPEAVTEQGTLDFDTSNDPSDETDGNRDLLANTTGTHYYRVHVVNCLNTKKLKAHFKKGQVITFWSGWFQGDTTATAGDTSLGQGQWITFAWSLDFYAAVKVDSGSSSGYSFTAGYIDPTDLTNGFTKIDDFTAAECIPLSSLLGGGSTTGVKTETVLLIHPEYDPSLKVWDYYFISPPTADAGFWAIVGSSTLVSGNVARWSYAFSEATGQWTPTGKSQVMAGGRTGTMYNAVESGNPTSGIGTMSGGVIVSSTDYTNLIKLQPIAPGCCVWVRQDNTCNTSGSGSSGSGSGSGLSPPIYIFQGWNAKGECS